MNHYSNPEMIASVERLANEETYTEGDRVLGVSVTMDKTAKREGEVLLDLREYPSRGKSLLIRVSLPDLMAALTSAALNRDDED